MRPGCWLCQHSLKEINFFFCEVCIFARVARTFKKITLVMCAQNIRLSKYLMQNTSANEGGTCCIFEEIGHRCVGKSGNWKSKSENFTCMCRFYIVLLEVALNLLRASGLNRALGQHHSCWIPGNYKCEFPCGNEAFHLKHPSLHAKT